MFTTTTQALQQRGIPCLQALRSSSCAAFLPDSLWYSPLHHHCFHCFGSRPRPVRLKARLTERTNKKVMPAHRSARWGNKKARWENRTVMSAHTWGNWESTLATLGNRSVMSAHEAERGAGGLSSSLSSCGPLVVFFLSTSTYTFLSPDDGSLLPHWDPSNLGRACC